ncbi:MAG: hypothetical protein BA862_03920 [Desulfobulbaceae bacterium S3730MH12]|nr:MAG: hypothetical protein BA862_03920 [Desulfobulbaceae bacterium S3730MH12]OEU84396.1 MAG: hypothetical protein BA873_09475 [Desulfobulbaceae bacterium C00003063]
MPLSGVKVPSQNSFLKTKYKQRLSISGDMEKYFQGTHINLLKKENYCEKNVSKTTFVVGGSTYLHPADNSQSGSGD